MTSSLAHRGPDAEGIWTYGPAVLGHRRLSIIDLSPEAHQPLLNEKGDLAIVVNGEIYNFQILRAELEAKGHVFRSRSDSEVVLHLYEEEGEVFLERLRGMFALAIWDGRRGQLVLARDRFGKKPLFYAFRPQGLVFASEMQALISAGMVEKKIDPLALDAYLALQYVPSSTCIFERVHKLPPGHILVCRPGAEANPRPYYRLRFDRRLCSSPREAAAELRSLLEEAVRIRLISDVPLGAFLSGGIDSTAVVGLMAGMSKEPIKTFSIGFTRQDHSELPFARQAAHRFQTDHHEMTVEPDMVNILPRLVRHYGEPYADSSALPTWYLCQFTKQYVTVALSGDAGDEAFGGYRRYRYEKVAAWLSGLPPPLPLVFETILKSLPLPSLQPVRDFGRRLRHRPASRYLGLVAHFPWDDRRRIYSQGFAEKIQFDRIASWFDGLLSGGSAGEPINKLMELDVATYLPDDILVKVDIASMAHALEVRCPLLDQKVMEFAASLPPEYKIRGLSSKVLFKKAIKDLLPPAIQRRGKQGFALPIDRWMRQELFSMARETLLDSQARGRGIFESRAVEDLLARHRRGESRGLQLWNLLLLELWFRTFID